MVGVVEVVVVVFIGADDEMIRLFGGANVNVVVCNVVGVVAWLFVVVILVVGVVPDVDGVKQYWMLPPVVV